MNKKIIAISLVLVIMVTCFSACKQKRETTKINGQEVIAVTDESGNPIINEKNEAVVLVTDREGEVITFESGEEQTRYMQIIDAVVIDGVAHGEKYNMNVLSGWTAGIGDRINKDGTDEKCYIHFTKNKDLEKDETLATYLEAVDEQNDLLVDGFKKEGYTVTINDGASAISSKNIGCKTRTYKIVDSDGKVVHYAVNYYFVADDTVYSVNYACENGIGYDESFDFDSYLKTNFTFLGELD